ncbi:MAG: hypothetical protein PHH83_05130 [Patescibacteria group bacterium]|nr:hypothetical protein [Patescibacteria group bacterium]
MEDKNQIERGNNLLSWHFPEFETYERTTTWYIIFFITVGLLMTYAIASLSFLFAVIILMSTIIILLWHRKEPAELDINIVEAGIEIGNKFYMYKEIKSFFIIYEPPQVTTLFILLKNRAKPRISVPLNGQNPIKVRDLLLNFIEEDVDKNDEPASDYLIRALKL